MLLLNHLVFVVVMLFMSVAVLHAKKRVKVAVNDSVVPLSWWGTEWIQISLCNHLASKKTFLIPILKSHHIFIEMIQDSLWTPTWRSLKKHIKNTSISNKYYHIHCQINYLCLLWRIIHHQLSFASYVQLHLVLLRSVLAVKHQWKRTSKKMTVKRPKHSLTCF